GHSVRSAPGAPPFAGRAERLAEGDPCELLLRLDEPAPGIAHFFAVLIGGQVCLPVRLYLYGDRAAAVVDRDEPLWRAWMNARFHRPRLGDGGLEQIVDRVVEAGAVHAPRRQPVASRRRVILDDSHARAQLADLVAQMTREDPVQVHARVLAGTAGVDLQRQQ